MTVQRFVIIVIAAQCAYRQHSMTCSPRSLTLPNEIGTTYRTVATIRLECDACLNSVK